MLALSLDSAAGEGNLLPITHSKSYGENGLILIKLVSLQKVSMKKKTDKFCRMLAHCSVNT